MLNKYAFAATACLIALPTWAVNKCTGPDGRVTFQELPCQGAGEKLNVRPATGSAVASPATVASGFENSAGERPTTELERLKQSNIKSENERKRREIEGFTLPNAYANLEKHQVACEREYRALQSDKRYAKNNLAGATWEQSLSQEMAALTSKCDMQSRQLTSNIEEIRKQCQKLGGCQ